MDLQDSQTNIRIKLNSLRDIIDTNDTIFTRILEALKAEDLFVVAYGTQGFFEDNSGKRINSADLDEYKKGDNGYSSLIECIHSAEILPGKTLRKQGLSPEHQVVIENLTLKFYETTESNDEN